MIAVIRVRGQVGLRRDAVETLNRLRLRKKYSCIVIEKPKKEQLEMINSVRDFVAFGEIKEEVFEKLLKERAKSLDNKKIEAKKIIEELKKGKKYEELNIKPFFRLHPPRGGIKSKIHFPKGVLGNHHEKINKLIERML